MPGGDRSGPVGVGPRSGRAAGYCANYHVPGFMNRFIGGGFGRSAGMGYGRGLGQKGRFGKSGRGFGFRNLFRDSGRPGWMRFGAHFGQSPNPDIGMEKQALKNRMEALKLQLDQIQNRLNDLESTASEK